MAFMTATTEALVEPAAAFVAAFIAMTESTLAAKPAADLPRAAADVTVAAAKPAPRTTAGLPVPRMRVAWPPVAKAGAAELDRR